MLKVAELARHRGRRRQTVTILRKIYFETAPAPVEMLRGRGTTALED